MLFQTKDRDWMIHRHGSSTRADALPDSIKPMLAVAGKLPADDEHWAFEIKWDGVRAILFVEGGRVRAQSRNDLDVTVSFPELADIGKFLGMTTCIIDGEIVALGEDGRPSFSRLQQRMHVSNQREAKRRALSDPVTFVAFDLLYIDGHALLSAPTTSDGTGSSHCTSRVRPSRPRTRSVTSPARTSSLPRRRTAWKASSPSGGPPRTGRVGAVPTGRRSRSSGRRRWSSAAGRMGRGERRDSLGALLLGIPDDGGLRYVGKVGTGFTARCPQ